MAKKKAKAKTKDLVPVTEGQKALVLAEFEQDAGAGFEQADKECYSIPYLIILQKGSPQCDPDDGAYLKGAKPGMLFNNVTNELFADENGVQLVPVAMARAFVEWKPRESGGGFKGTYSPSDPVVAEARAHRDESGRFCLQNGNHLMDTRYHFCLLNAAGSWRPVVLSFASTQIKKSRNWMTTMQNIQFQKSNGDVYTAPMYSHIYRVKTRPESNDRGAWRGWVIGLERRLDPSVMADRNVVLLAREFKKQLADGSARLVQPDQDPSATADEAPDF